MAQIIDPKFTLERMIDLMKVKGLTQYITDGDSAMFADRSKDRAIQGQNPGGIDFNPANLNLQIKRDGNGVPLPANFQPSQIINIDGLYPIIINITPINNLPLLLGINEKKKEIPQLSYVK